VKTGAIEWHLVSDGTFRLDGGAMFGVVPKPLWERRARPDERNRIRLGMNPLLIRTAGKTILVDAGCGRKEDAKFRDIFAVGDETNVVASLAHHGVAPEDVDVVVYTHLHFDHAGGATRRAEDGRVVPVFPNATHLVQKAELEDAEHPTERSRASYFPDNWVPIREAGLLEIVEGDVEVAPGVRTRVMKGHVRALTGVMLESDGQRAFYPTDNVPTSAHLPVPWVMAYDLYPLDTVTFKETLLPAAIDEGWTLVFEHDATVGAARVHKAERGFDLETVLASPSREAEA
jgi:glyoxylase-like metal-dependent hydrolase (beta-lactamase superfamily II)